MTRYDSECDDCGQEAPLDTMLVCEHGCLLCARCSCICQPPEPPAQPAEVVQ